MEYPHWIRYHYVTIGMEPMALHVYNDERLLQYLRHPGDRALALAEHALLQYRIRFGQRLDISRHSLAIEILLHVFSQQAAGAVDTFLDRIAPDVRGPVSALARKIRRSAEVIDCGEASIDTNRFIWDAMVPFRAAIYALARTS